MATIARVVYDLPALCTTRPQNPFRLAASGFYLDVAEIAPALGLFGCAEMNRYTGGMPVELGG